MKRQARAIVLAAGIILAGSGACSVAQEPGGPAGQTQQVGP